MELELTSAKMESRSRASGRTEERSSGSVMVRPQTVVTSIRTTASMSEKE